MKVFIKRLVLIGFVATICVACDKEDDGVEIYSIKANAVDLGLTSGTKWAKMNVGAENPWDCGDYFSWGEIEPKEIYDWSTYQHLNKEQKHDSTIYLGSLINKYQVADKYNGIWNVGTFIGDGKTTLEAIDDAAVANWGGDWVMPTQADFQELLDYCTVEWVHESGCVVSRNGCSIFFPLNSYNRGNAYYWTSTIDRAETGCACICSFYANAGTVQAAAYRFGGLSVRPICPKDGDAQGYEFVDFGLPSGKLWATCNIGASTPKEKGDFFAWGETKTKNEFLLDNYVYGKRGENGFYEYIKYQTEDKDYAGNWYKTEFIGDGKNILEMIDDVAAVRWGGKWKIPTKDQQQELISECFWNWTDDYNGSGVCGYVVYKAKEDADKGTIIFTQSDKYSLSDIHIFLPAANSYSYNTLFIQNGDINLSDGYYWSSSLGYTMDACIMRFNYRGEPFEYNYVRCMGLPVRPVCQP